MSCTRNIFYIMPVWFLFIAQMISADFYPSNIEITPREAIMRSNSTFNFLCTNRQNLPNSSLTVSLSRNISSDQMKISVKTINQTTILVQLKSRNYLGMFHLLCYVKGEQSHGNLADVYVTSSPGTIILSSPCLVYYWKYLKCKFYAPTIAEAIQNGYHPEIDFIQPPSALDSQAYKSHFEFLKNESTNETLVFVLKPTTEGVFPNNVPMLLEQKLEKFTATNYTFTISPVHVIIPEFSVKLRRDRKIEINLTDIPPSAICEKSISSNNNRTWTSFDSKSSVILTENCLSNTICEVCIKCRHDGKDPDGPEICKEISMSRFTISWHFVILFACLVSAVIILIIFIQRFSNFHARKTTEFVSNTLRCWRRRQNDDHSDHNPNGLQSNSRYSSTVEEAELQRMMRDENAYQLDNISQSEHSAVFETNATEDSKYQPFTVKPDRCHDACDPKVLKRS